MISEISRRNLELNILIRGLIFHFLIYDECDNDTKHSNGEHFTVGM